MVVVQELEFCVLLQKLHKPDLAVAVLTQSYEVIALIPTPKPTQLNERAIHLKNVLFQSKAEVIIPGYDKIFKQKI